MVYRYPHPEFFARLEKTDYQKYSGNLILYGAGKIGGVAAHCLKQKGIKVLAFCDSSSSRWNTAFCEHNIISPDELKENYKNCAVLVTTTFHTQLTKQLTQDGFHTVLDCVSLFLKIDFQNYDFWASPEYVMRCVEFYMSSMLFHTADTLLLRSVTIFLTSVCSLRCRECSSFTPYIETPRHYDAAGLLKNLDIVLEVFGSLERVTLLGGEPLLHPDLGQILRQINRDGRIELITAVTNGTIMPGQDVLLEMQNPKFIMRISDYGKLSSKLNDLIKSLDENHIKYEHTNYTYWNKNSKIGRFSETENELIDKFSKCVASLSIYIINNKLCCCNNAAVLCENGVVPPASDNFVDLSNPDREALKKEIVEFYRRMLQSKPIDACRYCSGLYCTDFDERLSVAEQTKQLLRFPKLF